MTSRRGAAGWMAAMAWRYPRAAVRTRPQDIATSAHIQLVITSTGAGVSWQRSRYGREMCSARSSRPAISSARSQNDPTTAAWCSPISNDSARTSIRPKFSFTPSRRPSPPARHCQTPIGQIRCGRGTSRMGEHPGGSLGRLVSPAEEGVENRPQPDQLQPSGGIGEDARCGVEHFLSLCGTPQSPEQGCHLGECCLGSLGVGAGQGTQHGQLGVGLGAAAGPGERVAQQQPRLEITASGHRGPGKPCGQRRVSELGGAAGGVGEQHRIRWQVGVQHQHRAAQGVTGRRPPVSASAQAIRPRSRRARSWPICARCTSP